MPFDANDARRRWMGILAKATPDEVDLCWRALPAPPAYDLLRRPEMGMVMVRGRTGGDGAPFNLGEMTVTRCSVRLADGTVGHAWRAGRAPLHSERAAVLDAVLQQGGGGQDLADRLRQVEQALTDRRTDTARKVAATKVDFFTMTRGED